MPHPDIRVPRPPLQTGGQDRAVRRLVCAGLLLASLAILGRIIGL
jgi:hypothetical protein